VISAVVPVYNGERHLAEAIESLMKSALITEIIAVDDGSTDGSVSLLSRHFPDVAIIRQANKRVSAARNSGWKAARNPLILFMDQDDRLLPSGLEKLNETMSGHSPVDFAYGDYFQIDEDGANAHRISQPDVSDNPVEKLLRVNCSSTVCCLFRKSRLERIGGFDESMIGCEDWDLYLRLAISGAKFAYVPEPVYEFRYYGTSTSKNFFLMWECYRKFEEKHRVATREADPALDRERRDRFLSDNLRHLYGNDESSGMVSRRVNRALQFAKILTKDWYLAGNLTRRAFFRP
jgi:glycosyltransferase involved in cell wall biosynthesis